MRSKEVANDYRYFPEPDLLPIVIDQAFIDSIRETLPELPDAKKARFVKEFGLNDYDASVITNNRDMAEYFESVARDSGDAKLTANWITGDLQALLNKNNWEITESPIQAQRLAQLIARIIDNTISGKIAKRIFEGMIEDSSSVDEIIEKAGLKQVTDSGEIEKLVDKVINNNPDQVQQFREGKQQVLSYLVGQAMKLSRGKANPNQVNQLLRDKLK